MSRLEFLLSKIRVIFLGSDEFLLKEVKKVCAKTKKFTATNYDEGEFGLNLAKNFDIALCEVRNSHCVEFIEDISYENPNLKIIALEPSLALNGGGGASAAFKPCYGCKNKDCKRAHDLKCDYNGENSDFKGSGERGDLKNDSDYNGECGGKNEHKLSEFLANEFLTQILEFGIFAYIPSPVNARNVEVALARYAHLHCKNSRIKFSPTLIVDKDSQQIYINDKPLLLSPKLRQIFWLLFDNLNRVVSHYTIINAIDENMCLNSLRMAIVRLKRLLRDKSLIINAPGDGYMLVCEECGNLAV